MQSTSVSRKRNCGTIKMRILWLMCQNNHQNGKVKLNNISRLNKQGILHTPSVPNCLSRYRCIQTRYSPRQVIWDEGNIYYHSTNLLDRPNIQQLVDLQTSRNLCIFEKPATIYIRITIYNLVNSGPMHTLVIAGYKNRNQCIL